MSDLPPIASDNVQPLFDPELTTWQDERTAVASHLAKLIFLSYRFSQGGIGTQNRILQYIEANHQPELFSESYLPEVKILARKMIEPYFLNQKLHPATAIPWEDDSPEGEIKTELIVTNELAGFFDRFKNREQIHGYASSPADIAESIIVMDADYLTREGGRSGGSMALKVKVDEYPRDPFDSMFIRHSVLGIGTHTDEYDAMFRKLGKDEVIQKLNQHALGQLQQILKIYIKEHPGMEHDERLIRIGNTCQGYLHGQ